MKLNDIIDSPQETKELKVINMISNLMKKSKDVEIWNIPDFMSNDEEDNDTTTDDDGVPGSKKNINEYSSTCELLNSKLRRVSKGKGQVACMPVRKEPLHFAEDFSKSEPSTQNETQITEADDPAESWLLEKQAQIEAEIDAGKKTQEPANPSPVSAEK
jgi:hypothetical protein